MDLLHNIEIRYIQGTLLIKASLNTDCLIYGHLTAIDIQDEERVIATIDPWQKYIDHRIIGTDSDRKLKITARINEKLAYTTDWLAAK